MEKFVASLYNRLDQEKQLSLFLIQQRAMDEVHNCGLLSQLPPGAAALVHDPDPNVRIDAKTALAKSVGKSFILSSAPAVKPAGGMEFRVEAKYDARFPNSIAICIQGGLEGLYMTGLYAEDTLDYTVSIRADGADASPLVQILAQLDSMYESFHITAVIADAQRQSAAETPKPADGQKEQPQKKGLFSSLFGGKKKPEAKPAAPSKASAGIKTTSKSALSYDKMFLSCQTRLLNEKNTPGLAKLALAVKRAEDEVISNQALFRDCAGYTLSPEQWAAMTANERLDMVMLMGSYGVVESAILCVDFSTLIPYCDALALFMRAQALPEDKRVQLVDAGEGEDTRPLRQAVAELSVCDSHWKCHIN